MTREENTGEAMRIPLTRGKYALVDAEDYPRLARYSWHAFHDKKDGRWLAVRGETGKWRVQIRCDGATTHIGYFTTAEEAAVAYDRKAREVFGESAYQNAPDTDPAPRPDATRGDEG